MVGHWIVFLFFLFGLSCHSDHGRDLDQAGPDYRVYTHTFPDGPAHFMNAVRMPAATTVRTSIDYMAGAPKTMFWPQFHTVSMLAWAVGLLRNPTDRKAGRPCLFRPGTGVPERARPDRRDREVRHPRGQAVQPDRAARRGDPSAGSGGAGRGRIPAGLRHPA